MQKHTGERPFICKLCGKGFVHKHYLSEHMDYHTDEKKHQCQQCGKRFQSISTLSKHIERHKGQRSHFCPHCPKVFLVHGDLRSHIRVVHEKTGNQTGIPVFKSDSKPEDIPPNYVHIDVPPDAKNPYPSLKMSWSETTSKSDPLT